MTELGIILAGCFAWTFIEYGMHHWNGHLMKGKTLFSKEHLAHHSKKDHFSTLPKKVAYSGLIAVGLWVGGCCYWACIPARFSPEASFWAISYTSLFTGQITCWHQRRPMADGRGDTILAIIFPTHVLIME